MTIRTATVAGTACLVILFGTAPSTATPRGGGTIAVTAQPETDASDPVERVTIDAATATLGDKGFTILNDPLHAAYIAEVATTRTEVGSSVVKGRTPAPLVTGLAVTIPTSRGKDVVAPLQRTELHIRIRRRGEERAFWHGAAVTVRSAGSRGAGVEQVASALSQAALSSYPTSTAVPVSIP